MAGDQGRQERRRRRTTGDGWRDPGLRGIAAAMPSEGLWKGRAENNASNCGGLRGGWGDGIRGRSRWALTLHYSAASDPTTEVRRHESPGTLLLQGLQARPWRAQRRPARADPRRASLKRGAGHKGSGAAGLRQAHRRLRLRSPRASYPARAHKACGFHRVPDRRHQADVAGAIDAGGATDAGGAFRTAPDGSAGAPATSGGKGKNRRAPLPSPADHAHNPSPGPWCAPDRSRSRGQAAACGCRAAGAWRGP